MDDPSRATAEVDPPPPAPPGDAHPARLPEAVRADFPILSARFDGHPLVYLDNAATTHKPRAVLDAIVGYYSTVNGNVGRGHYALSRAAADRYDRAREAVRRAIGAAHADEIVFCRGTTDAVNLVAGTFGRRVVGRGDQVVVTGMEHNSNLLPWRRLCEEAGAELVVVPAGAHGRVSREDFSAAFGPRVRLAAVAHVSNVLGTVNPVRALAGVAHRNGVPIVVDGAQAVPHRPVDVRELDADFYCFSGHKVYGPMGVGVLYGRRDLLADTAPYQVGGGMVKGATRTGPVRYLPVPGRFEAGTPNIEGAVGLAAALRYLHGLGWDAVRRHDRALVRYAVAALGEIDRVRVVGDPGADPSGIVSFVVDGVHPYDVGGHLDAHGVAVRGGVHCAADLLDDLGLLGTVRMSFAVYNSEDEVDLVAGALRTVRPGTWTP
ncbi:cysteine desulfurase [Actinomadura sp. NPDC047616]|uniref:aminotransferase class V-fold PLP-dependent enzyme n=1 Tax=Actinomadura sp. NPDC047616 TaxID=3155914 RepID=UPI0033C2776E